MNLDVYKTIAIYFNEPSFMIFLYLFLVLDLFFLLYTLCVLVLHLFSFPSVKFPLPIKQNEMSNIRQS